MNKTSFNQLLRRKGESSSDFLNRTVPLYQSLRYGKKVDCGIQLSDQLSEFQAKMFEDEVMNNISEVVRKQCKKKRGRLGRGCDFDDFCANGVAVCVSELYKFNPDISDFDVFIVPHMRRALSLTIEQYYDVNRNNQSSIKKIRRIRNELAMRFNIPDEMVRTADIAFELKKQGDPLSIEKIESLLAIVQGNKDIDEYAAECENATWSVNEAEFNIFVLDGIKEAILESFAEFNDVDKFLCYKAFNDRYKNLHVKEIGMEEVFIKICKGDEVSSQHISKEGVEAEHIENRLRYIRRRLRKLGEQFDEIEYQDKVESAIQDMLFEEANKFFKAIEI